MKTPIIFICFLLASIAYSSKQKEHPGFFCRVLKISKNKNIIILDLGREENIKRNDHGLLSYHGDLTAKIKLRQLSSTRSMWEIVEPLNMARLQSNNVFHFKFISAKKFTEDKGDLPKSEIKAQYKSPLPFPFDSKAKILFGLESGSRYRSDFDYPISAAKGNHGQRYNSSIAWLWRTQFDHRVYWGPSLKYEDQKNKFSLLDGTKIIEKKNRISFGPLAQVIFWGNEKYSLIGQFQFLANYDRLTISQNNFAFSTNSDAQFSGVSLSLIHI